MTTQISITSPLGTHHRATATEASPAVLRNISPSSCLAIFCDADTTALVELSLTHTSQPPLYVPAAIGSAGVVPAGSRAIEIIDCKLAAVRVTASGPGTVVVEVLQ